MGKVWQSTQRFFDDWEEWCKRRPRVVALVAVSLALVSICVSMFLRHLALTIALLVIFAQAFAVYERAEAQRAKRPRPYLLFLLTFSALAAASFLTMWVLFIALDWVTTGAVVPPSRPQAASQQLMPYLKWPLFILFVTALIAPLAALYIRYRDARKAAGVAGAMALSEVEKELWGERWKRSNNDLFISVMVHFIPFSVMSLALLFAYHDLTQGSPNGIAAVGSVMILYLLSQLGASLLSTSVSMRDRAEELKETIAGATNHLLAVGIIKVYAAILQAYYPSEDSREPERRSQALPPGAPIEHLLETWKDIAYIGLDPNTGHSVNEANARTTGRLIRAILAAYLSEEYMDLSASLDPDRIPPEVRVGTQKDGKKPIYIATNVGFFATALARAIEALSGSEGRPCIVSLTTVLPSWWWNWPRTRAQNAGKRYPYAPVEEYREALFQAVDKSNACIYRTVLVRDDDETGDSDYEEAIAGKDMWEKESKWAFWMNKDDIPKPRMYVPDNQEDKDFKNNTRNSKNNTDAGGAANLRVPDAIDLGTDCRPYWVLKIKDPANHEWKARKSKPFSEGLAPIGSNKKEGNEGEAEGFLCRINRYYAERLHRRNGIWTGDTRLCHTTLEEFKNLHRRTDMTFLGISTNSPGDGSKPPKWPNKWPGDWKPQLAMLGMLRACEASETMFLTIVHEEQEVEKLWKEARSAIEKHEEKQIESAADWVKE